MFIASGSISNSECHPSSPVPAVSLVVSDVYCIREYK